MMLWLLLCIVVVPFGFVLLYGAPYLPTRRAQAKEALDLLNLKEGDVFIDLGSGDGAVLIEAASRGLRCYGYELNPLVYIVSKLRTRKFGSEVTIYCNNFWNEPLPKNTKGVFVFLLDKYMPKLNTKLESELKKGGRLVSYTFQIPGKEPVVAKNALFVYEY